MIACTHAQTEAKEKLEGIRNGTKELTKELKQLEAAYNQNGKDYEVGPCLSLSVPARGPRFPRPGFLKNLPCPRWYRHHQTIGAAVKKAKADFAAYERENIKLQENVKHLKDKDKKQRKALEKVRPRNSTMGVWGHGQRLTGSLSCTVATPRTPGARQAGRAARPRDGRRGRHCQAHGRD